MRLALLLVCLAFASGEALANSIVTGGKTGTYFAIGGNLKDLVLPELEVKDSEGSWANVESLSATKGVSMAIVQSDVYSAFVRLRDSPSSTPATKAQYAELLRNLRVVMPLYKEEIHFIVRKDDPMENVGQIRGKQIWMDVEKSGTYLTALNIYTKIFGEEPNAVTPFLNPSVTGDDMGTKRRRSALMSLSEPQSYAGLPKVDVIVLVGGQPLALLQKTIPGNLKLLRYDDSTPNSARVLETYNKADIAKASYPMLNIPGESLTSLSVDSYLITANFADKDRNQFIKTFATQLCEKFDDLKAKGHPKWRALSWAPGTPLPRLSVGWRYSDYSKAPLDRCGRPAGAARPPEPPPAPMTSAAVCTPQHEALGICHR